MNSRLMARVKKSFGGGRTKLRTQEKNKIVMTLARRSQYAVFSGDYITPPSMVKCTSVGEIEEEDGKITVAHPSSIVMTTYFMGLGHYTIVMGNGEEWKRVSFGLEGSALVSCQVFDRRKRGYLPKSSLSLFIGFGDEWWSVTRAPQVSL
ncbi:hypothetical protein F2Q69_00053570 [Brassica cretica]|uniref:Uncharacterized protein n=1 Tax=Brassica cretica TaxID=69181 RepID=A0A8S9MYQ0_BRACR|nr:hypothetical protein F2Q69_00053570 [Brassica cretica]